MLYEVITLAFVLGQLIAWIYAWSHSGLSYSRSYVNTLILLPITRNNFV